MRTKEKISISVVSHGQLSMVAKLFSDLDSLNLEQYICEVILTKNIPEPVKLKLNKIPLKVIENKEPKGFGANHNQAYEMSSGAFFCVVNPDVRLEKNVFEPLLQALNSNDRVGIISPYVFSSLGERENNIRYFPTVLTLIKKFMGYTDLFYPEKSDVAPYSVEWAAGMFLIFKAELYDDIGGFDEGFFLYYEDVDICIRCWKAGWMVYSSPLVDVIHDGQRASHTEFKYLKWHLGSLVRYLFKHSRTLPAIDR